MQTSTLKTLTWLSIFAVAMAFLESSVVIYLRELYYPQGFQFPLQIIPSKIAKVELWREAATIIMLIGAGYMAGSNNLTRFAYFIIAFAIWDIFYYVFLYLFIQWPESPLTWDILFLIPAPWTGPVIAPCLVSLGMIIFGSSILKANANKTARVSSTQWFLLIGGCVIIITSFMYDYIMMVSLKENSAHFLPDHNGLLAELRTYVPSKFNWSLFLIGLGCSFTGTLLYMKDYQFQNLKDQAYEKK